MHFHSKILMVFFLMALLEAAEVEEMA